MRTRVRKAFTLVEILIVVVILGILAAIVVPQFTHATQDAMAGNLQTQLDTLNNQIELYKARNNGQLPPLFAAGGTTTGPSDPGPWADLINQGYIKGPPQNPACPSRAAGGDPGALDIGTGYAAAGVANHGWGYDTGTATLYASYMDEVNGVVTTTP
jgi:general secretion pathway protein G